MISMMRRRRDRWRLRQHYHHSWLDGLFGIIIVAIVAFVVAMVFFIATYKAHAGGWPSFGKYEHRTGKCGGMREVGMSVYNEPGGWTSNGVRFNGRANHCASNVGGWPRGAHVTLLNPHNGKRSHCTVNDTLPRGRAWAYGVRLDATPQVFAELGLNRTRWICAQ